MNLPSTILSGQFWRELSQYHLSFPDKKMATFIEGGAEITKAVSYGMPKLHPQYLDATVFLYKSVEDARQGKSFGGTGFIIGLPVEVENTSQEFVHLSVVTNWHVACRDGFSVIRLHKKNGTQKIIETDPSDWEFIQKCNDVAVTPITLDQDEDNFSFIPTGLFVGRDDDQIGVGDDVFMIGRFIDYDGVENNAPAVRFGNISMMPQLIKSNFGERESYCVDMHSRTGFSGSPVFVYRTPGGDFSEPGLCDLSRFMLFLGVHWGQVPEKWEIVDEDKISTEASLITEGKYIKGLSGMTCVAPAWSIMEILEMDKLKQQRKQAAEQMSESLRDKPLLPIEESADGSDDAETGRDDVLATMLNTPPKHH